MANRTIEDANDESRRLRHEAEDYVDQKLASFEIVLERTRKMVQAGREKLQGPSLAAPTAEEQPEPEDRTFFDQDQQ